MADEGKLREDVRKLFSGRIRSQVGLPPIQEPHREEEEEETNEDIEELSGMLVEDVCGMIARNVTEEIVLKTAEALGIKEKIGLARIGEITRQIKDRINETEFCL